jgi:Rod binding domain-containing protein
VSDISGLSSVTGAAVPIPADVRAAGKDAETTYRAALGFERQLLEQLTKSMAKDMTGGTGDSDDESGASGASAATSAYNDMLPGTLADAVTNAGGLGLAHDLFLSMRSATS